jgi:hypothetical protein
MRPAVPEAPQEDHLSDLLECFLVRRLRLAVLRHCIEKKLVAGGTLAGLADARMSKAIAAAVVPKRLRTPSIRKSLPLISGHGAHSLND